MIFYSSDFLYSVALLVPPGCKPRLSQYERSQPSPSTVSPAVTDSVLLAAPKRAGTASALLSPGRDCAVPQCWSMLGSAGELRRHAAPSPTHLLECTHTPRSHCTRGTPGAQRCRGNSAPRGCRARAALAPVLSGYDLRRKWEAVPKAALPAAFCRYKVS